MGGQPSYVGPGIPKSPSKGATRNRGRSSRKVLIVIMAVVVAVLLSVLAYVGNGPGLDKKSRSLSVTILGVALTYQYYDTVMPCNPCLPLLQPGPHVWNHAAGADGLYGTQDDCPHCSAYCAPASISMIANYRLRGNPFVLQDFIYDNGKASGGETPGNGIIETHGLGMFHGAGGFPPEVQVAMTWAVGPITQHDWFGTGNQPMTVPLLVTYMAKGTPILWLDNGGFPASSMYPSASNKLEQGHAKVIAGHDDSNTRGDPTDDLLLIYDPWPEYSDKGFLPWNCSKGPGGSWDPYWQPLNDVNFLDKKDVYLVDTFPAIPEFASTFVPAAGLTVVVIAASILVRRREK